MRNVWFVRMHLYLFIWTYDGIINNEKCIHIRTDKILNLPSVYTARVKYFSTVLMAIFQKEKYLKKSWLRSEEMYIVQYSYRCSHIYQK